MAVVVVVVVILMMAMFVHKLQEITQCHIVYSLPFIRKNNKGGDLSS